MDPDDQKRLRSGRLQRQPDGSFTWISRDPRIPVGTPQTAAGGAYSASYCDKFSDLGHEGGSNTFKMSADGHTILFCSDRSLDDADPGNPSVGNNTIQGTGALYKWSDGQLSFLRRPDGSRPSGSSGRST